MATMKYSVFKIYNLGQWYIKLSLQLCLQHIVWAPVEILAAPHPVQLSLVVWEGSGVSLKCLGSFTLFGDLDKAPGFRSAYL